MNLVRALGDTSTESVKPAGAEPGDGGPFVGPYIASATVLTATLNGGSSVTVSAGATISASVEVQSGNGGNAAGSIGWRIATTAPGNNAAGDALFTCVNIADHSNTTVTNTFNITAPGSAGTYNAYFRSFSNDACSANRSNLLTLTSGVTVLDPNAPAGTLTVTPDVVNESSTNSFSLAFVQSTGTTHGGALSVQNAQCIRFTLTGFTGVSTPGVTAPVGHTWIVVSTLGNVVTVRASAAADQLHQGEQIVLSVSANSGSPAIHTWTAQSFSTSGCTGASNTASDSVSVVTPNVGSANLDQCANGPLNAPVTCTGSAWQNGNINSNQGHYREGDSVPFRLILTGVSAGTHTVDLGYDTTDNSGNHSYDYLTSFDRTETTANPCSGIASCVLATDESEFPIPTDPLLATASPAVSQIAGSMSIFDGAITNVQYIPPTPTVEGNGQERFLRVTFTTSSPTVVLAWGGHAASELDWGPNDSVGSSSGSSYHMRLEAVDGGGGQQDRSIQVGAIFPVPSKDTVATASVIDVGQSVSDTATFAGSPTPAGTVTFFLCGPSTSAPDCAFGGSYQSGPFTLNASGSATSAAFTPTLASQAGFYCFRALYEPAATSPYSAAIHTNLTTECFVVRAGPGLATQVSQSSITSGSVTDTATLTQSGQLGTVNGTVSFFVCGPASSAPDCANGGTQVGGAVTVASGSATSAPFTPTIPGMYCFRAAYLPAAGSNYLTTSHTNNTTECFVLKAAPGLSTQASTQAMFTGQTVTDTATFTDPGALGPVTGTVDFYVCGPGVTAPNCTIGGTLVTDNAVVAANSATSTAFTPAQAGTYCFRAEYTPAVGSNYLATSHTNQTIGTSGGECFTVAAGSDLALTKVDEWTEGPNSFDFDPVFAGSSGMYRLTVTNNGPSPSTGFTITDTLPSGFTFTSTGSSLGCTSVDGTTVTCVSSGVLANGASAHFFIAYDVDSTIPNGTVKTNSASVTGTPVDATPGNNSSVQDTTIIEDVDLEITKTFTDDSVTAGAAGTHTFTLLVQNLGDSDADNVTISDVAPAGLTFISEDSANCAIVAGDLVCSFAHLGPNSSTTITVTYDVPATTNAGTVTNSATVESDEDLDTDSDTLVVIEDVDLEITKTFTDDSVTAGAAGTHTFTLLVQNLGDSDADNVTISDVAPAGLTFISEDSANCAIVAGDLVCSFAHLGPNSSTTITVTYDVPATTNAGTVTNSATVESDEDLDTDSDTLVVIEDVDLEITKTFTDDSVTAGAAGTHTFTLLVQNLGDSDADNVTISDVAPAGLTFISEDSANCAIVAGDLVCSFAHLGPNSSTTITVTYDVPATTNAGTVTNSATVESDEDLDTDSDTLVVIEDVDLEITKTFTDDSVTAGAAGTHTFTLLVQNLGDSDADNVTISDVAPAGLTFISEDSANCAIVAGDLVCSFAHLGPNSSTTITVTYDVPATTNAGTVTNSATVESDEDLDTDSDTLVVIEDVDLEITKTFTDDSVTAGAAGTHTFTLLVQNLGDSDADNVTISDVAPAGLTFISEDSANCAIVAGDLVCSFAHLGPNSSTTITVTYDVPATTNAGTVTNSATVESDEDLDTDSDTLVVIEDVDLEITKTFTDDSVTAGAAGTHTFTLLVQNLGDSDADNVTISDVAPAGLTFISEDSANCAIVAGDLVCSFAHLGPNSSTTITVTYDVPATTNAGTVTNSATVESDEDLDTDSDTLVVIEDVDLEITKTFTDDSVTAGAAGTHTFTLLVQNLGDSDADNVTISDVAPAGLTFISEDSANCAIVAGDLVCSFAHLGPNSSTTITVTYDVPATTNAGTVTNSATVESDEDLDTDSDTLVVIEDVDLEITKTFTDDSVTAGAAGTHTFTLLVQNLGDSDADNVTISDVAPAGLTFISEDSANCAIVAGDLVCSFAHLGPNSSTTITVTYDVPATTNAGTVTNSATVESDEDLDTDSDTLVVIEDVDLEITKTFTDDSVTAGAAGTHTFTLLVQNLGDSDADNVTISDVAPAGLTFISEDSANCAIVAGDLVCSFAHLGPNSSTTITVTYDVPATTNAGTVTNSATVESDEDLDTDSDTLVVIEDVDLEITKTFTDDSVTAGAAGTHTFTLLVQNLGDSDADNVTISDVAPAGLTFISEDSANCAIVAGDLVCSFAHLGPNSSTTITVTYDVPATTNAGTVTNSATVESDEDLDTDSDTLVVIEDVDLEITKTFTDDSVTAGAAGTHTFTLLVQNLGDSDADNVTISDVAPAGLTFISEDSANCAIVAGDLVCSFAHLGPNSSTTITVTYDVPATTNAGTVTNSATVESDEDLDTDSDTLVVIEDVDLEITKTFTDDSVTAGAAGTHTFTLLVQNLGDSDADNVTISDVAPAGLTFISEDSANCAIVAGDLVCSFAHLGPNSSTTITVTYDVPATTNAGTVTNSATVESDEDLDTDSDTLVVIRQADLAITKTDAPDPVVAGTNLVNTITVTNNGPSFSSGFTVSDPLPADVTYVSDDSADCTFAAGTVTCVHSGDLAVGASVVYHVTVAVDADIVPGAGKELSNTATITVFGDPQPAGSPANDTATAMTDVVRQADLAITKTDAPDPVVAGTNLVYTITVTNNGPSFSSGFTVSDPLPADVTYVSDDSADCTFAAGTVTCVHSGDLAVGASVVYHVTVAVDADIVPGAGKELSNTATITVFGDPQPAGSPANDTATAMTDVVRQADLAITKTDAPDPVVAGTNLVYTITVTNNGPSFSSGFTVSDPLPADVTYVSDDSADCTFAAGTVTCVHSGDLAVGASVVYHVTVAVDADIVPGAGKELSNTATITVFGDPQPAGSPANDTATAMTDVVRQADLAITKTDAPDPVVAGTNLVYTITVTNNGPSFSSGFTVSDPLPADVTYVSDDSADCTFAAGTVTCVHSGDLAVGASVVYHVTVAVDADIVPGAGKELSNTATITVFGDPQPAGSPANDTATAMTDVVRQADLAITKTATPSSVFSGGTISYTVTVTNNGPSYSSGYTMTDNLDPNVKLVAVPAGCVHSGAAPDGFGGTLTCVHSADLANGASDVYSFQVLVRFPAAGTITNTATVTAEVPSEDTSGNNQATVITPIVLRPTDGSSTMTDSAFKIQTDLGPWTISDFEILLNNQGTIVATNPGQFYYHQRMTMIDTGMLKSSVDFEIDWPTDFVPQISGGQPIHAYVRLDGSTTWTLWTDVSGKCWSNDMGCVTTTGPHDGSITVNNVPSKAEVWVTVHLDLKCKGMNYDSCMKNLSLTPKKDPYAVPYTFGPFKSTATQKISGIPVASSTTSTTLVGRGKKVTVVYGTLIDKVTGLGIKDTWVRISQTVGSSTYTATAQTSMDGFYVFFDGQACTEDDGIDGGCTGFSTPTSPWTFQTGSNVSTTITILGTGSAPAAVATLPKDTGNDSYAYAEVRTGTNTWATKSPPAYTAGVAKGTAHNRDWRFWGNP